MLNLFNKKSKNSNSFESLGLSSPILKALDDKGYKHPTPIQKKQYQKLLKAMIF